VNIDEATALLEFVAAAELRRLPPSAAPVWAELLSDVTLDEAMQAVREHYRISGGRLYPADVRTRVREQQEYAARQRYIAARTQRALAYDDPDPAEGEDPPF
jgi:hypothetical protein